MAASKLPESVVDYVKHIKRIYPGLKDVYVVGSYVRGTAHSESDIDIALVFDEVSDGFDLQLQLMKIRRQYDLRIEPHVFSTDDFDKIHSLLSEESSEVDSPRWHGDVIEKRKEKIKNGTAEFISLEELKAK